MGIKIYNTLTRKKEDFIPNSVGKVGMYVCGPTVYNYIHIGNARTFLSFDVIRRYLTWRGFEVVFIQNITDIDDKIINRAAEEGTDPQEVAEKYTAAFQDQMAALRVEPPSAAPKATETIPEMIKLVQDLEANELAYETPDGIYFPVRRFKDYGRLSGRSLEEMRAGERVDIDPNKEDPMDFALWKKAKPGEPKWPSPWGDGRPGWHLECSAMSLKYLEMSFDIHGGASDLIFPHHENETAQSEGATGKKPFVKYWVHGGLLNINREKMSKSLGNFTLLNDALKIWPPHVIRMFMLGTHYRNPLDFTETGLNEAAAKIERIETAISNVDFAIESKAREALDKTAELKEANLKTRDRFLEVMDDDFNSASALGVIFEHIREVNSMIEGAKEIPGRQGLKEAKELILELLNGAMGLGVGGEKVKAVETIKVNDAEIAIENLISDRERARENKNWDEADRIRQVLAEAGVEIEDTPQGTRWKLKSKTAG